LAGGGAPRGHPAGVPEQGRTSCPPSPCRRGRGSTPPMREGSRKSRTTGRRPRRPSEPAPADRHCAHERGRSAMFDRIAGRALVPVGVVVTGFLVVCFVLLYAAIKNVVIHDSVGHANNLAGIVLKSTRYAMLNSDRELNNAI